jgi:hypothetical protein
MGIKDDLLNALSAALVGLPHPYTSASAAWDIYEAYVWVLFLRAALDQGGQITFETAANQPASSLRFRVSPGNVYSTTHDYTHAVIAFPHPSIPMLEAHIGIKVAGRSGVPHECDVAVIDRNEGLACRRGGAHPRVSKLFLSVECKFYASSLGIGLARGFLGLTKDIQPKNRFFVASVTSDQVEKIVAAHELKWECPVVPSNNGHEGNLISQFSTSLRDYVARGRI